MKKLKMKPIKLIAMSVITIALSSCVGQETIENQQLSFKSTTAEFTAGYKLENGKLEVLIPPRMEGTFDFYLSGEHTISSLILDQRKKDRTTNWNFKLRSQFSVIAIPGLNGYTIKSEPTTPAFYNILCADTWDEPVTNGELSKAWRLEPETGQTGNPSYEDDMMKFSAFDNKFSYKPGLLRSPNFNKIVDTKKNEAFATFTIGKEALPDSLYTHSDGKRLNFVIMAYTKQGEKVEFVEIKYDNGNQSYILKLYKLFEYPEELLKGGILIYMVSNDGLGSLQAIVPVTDTEYANYAK